MNYTLPLMLVCWIVFLSGCNDSKQGESSSGGGASAETKITQESLSQSGENRRLGQKSSKKSGKQIADEIQAKVVSPSEGESEFLDWLRANGIEKIEDVVNSLRGVGEPGKVTSSEEAFCRALVTFYNETDDVFLGELLEEIAYPGVYRGQLVRTFSSQVVENAADPNKPLVDLLTRGVPESVHALHYMKIITDSAKYGDPRKILSQIPDPNDGKIGMIVVSQIAPMMLRQTPEATIKYFTEMTTSPLKDAGTYFLVRYAADQGDFEVARNWVENTSDEKIKAGALKYIERLESIGKNE